MISKELSVLSSTASNTNAFMFALDLMAIWYDHKVHSQFHPFCMSIYSKDPISRASRRHLVVSALGETQRDVVLKKSSLLDTQQHSLLFCKMTSDPYCRYYLWRRRKIMILVFSVNYRIHRATRKLYSIFIWDRNDLTMTSFCTGKIKNHDRQSDVGSSCSKSCMIF